MAINFINLTEREGEERGETPWSGRVSCVDFTTLPLYLCLKLLGFDLVLSSNSTSYGANPNASSVFRYAKCSNSYLSSQILCLGNSEQLWRCRKASGNVAMTYIEIRVLVCFELTRTYLGALSINSPKHTKKFPR